ncbi:unnamed protein product [Cunninghamella blakesleeana]
MPLEVIGAGFGRTSTHSLYLALEILGYKTHHMVKLFANPDEDPEVWTRAYDDPNHEDEWEKVYGKYQAAVDFPTCSFYKELSERYPDAKVILTVRSAESWFKSAHNTIFKQIKDGTDHLTGHRKKIAEMCKHTFFDGLMEKDLDKLYDEEYMCKVFNDHVEEVKNTIPKERLLVMNMGDGWGPLCEFLGKPIPNEPYPVSNSTAEFENIVKDFRN